MSRDSLAARFETDREHLRGVAHRMLGSLDEADDAVQQAWQRADRSDITEVENLTGWLTTVTARVCLDMLRARRRRNERSLVDTADNTVDGGGSSGFVGQPEEEAVRAEAVGLAFLVVLDRLSPEQRVAFVLHDVFAMPFDQIAAVVDRTPAATKKLASRARARMRGASESGVPATTEHRVVVEAFLAAARTGDVNRLLELLAPDVVRRADRVAVPNGPTEVRGARAVADETRGFAIRARSSQVASVDGAPGIVVAPLGRLFAVLRVSVQDGLITELDVVADAASLAAIEIGTGVDRVLRR